MNSSLDYWRARYRRNPNDSGPGSHGVSVEQKAAFIAAALQPLHEPDPTRRLWVLDYGAGNGNVADAVEALDEDITLERYDPAIEAIGRKPDARKVAFDVVLCLEVLEHQSLAAQQMLARDLWSYEPNLLVITAPLHKEGGAHMNANASPLAFAVLEAPGPVVVTGGTFGLLRQTGIFALQRV